MATNANSIVNVSAGFNQIPQVNAEVYNRACLERLTPELFFTKYGEKGMGAPKKSGDTQSWRRWNSLAVATNVITDGVTPDGVNVSVTKVSATVKQYGNWSKFTDYIDLVGLDDTVLNISEIMGENAGESIDTIVRDIMAAGTNVIYAGSKASRVLTTGTDKISAVEILKVRRALKRNKVKPITLPGGGTGYLWFIHTDVATDLMQTAEWISQNTYTSTSRREDGTLGKMYGIYFLEADNAPKFTAAGAAGVDIFGNLVIGRGAYGVPDIAGSQKPEIIIHKAGESGINDPLNQFNTIGWKACLTALILQQLALIRFECGASI